MIYFVQEESGPIKIGHVKDDYPELLLSNVQHRVTELQIGNPRQLQVLATMPGSISDEHEIHAKFTDHRIRGEWFKPDSKLLNFINEYGSTFPKSQWKNPWESSEEAPWVADTKKQLFPRKFSETS